MISRRTFLKWGSATGAALALARHTTPGLHAARPHGVSVVMQATGSLDPVDIPKYQTPLLIPPAMPRLGVITEDDGTEIDYYVIAVRQFAQQILPEGLPATTVWGLGARQFGGTVAEGGTFNYPSFTIEARHNRPVRVRWVNELVDENGDYLPHLLPVDQTLHWANPPGGNAERDSHNHAQEPYTGPVPFVMHLHGAHTNQESDGYPEAWYLPDARNIPEGYATTGTYYELYKESSPLGANWKAGSAVFEYPNDQRPTTSWFHDHTLGMTRLNVYAGPAGFYLLRGGEDDQVEGTLPGPAPAAGDAPDTRYYEIPIVIQDRSFYDDGSLFYPDHRAFFEGLNPDDLQVPFKPDPACDGLPSDVPRIWNPEFFGNTMVVNGNTWPYLEVEPRRYRLRLLNGCNSRFLILQPDQPVPMTVIGVEGGFLAAPVPVEQVLLGPAERADVIFDFTDLPEGTEILLLNVGPDEPFGGGTPGVDFDPADPASTGQVMQFRVGPLVAPDETTPADELVLPALQLLGEPDVIRRLSLVEEDSATVKVRMDADEAWILPVVAACDDPEAVPFGPVEADLGVVVDGEPPTGLSWDGPITEEPVLNTVEVWELHNFTMDAHPIHVHLIMFQVIEREIIAENSPNYDPAAGRDIGYTYAAGPGEEGWKDTVIAYPGEITRIKMFFDVAGLYVWHCHILEHEDNEMMRPFRVIELVESSE